MSAGGSGTALVQSGCTLFGPAGERIGRILCGRYGDGLCGRQKGLWESSDSAEPEKRGNGSGFGSSEFLCKKDCKRANPEDIPGRKERKDDNGSFWQGAKLLCLKRVELLF